MTFLCWCFYLISSDDEAIAVLKRAQEMLAASSLRLHRFTSNTINVMKIFPAEDLAKGLKDLNLQTELPHMQRRLRIYWDVVPDEFTFWVSPTEKPCTQRGMLSTIKSLYDPLGFAAPVCIWGRGLLWDLTPVAFEWDNPLSESKLGDGMSGRCLLGIWNM